MDTEKPILKRIQKLLTLSKDKGASKAEAERAMEMAQRLMTKYNITMANIEDDTPASKIKHEYFFSRAVLNPADTEITAILCRFYKVKSYITEILEWWLLGLPKILKSQNTSTAI